MKIKLFKLIGILSIAGVAGFFMASSFHGFKESHRYKLPPPGFELVTDGEGHWGVRCYGGYIIETDYHKKHLNSKQAAIDRAWRQYDFDQERIHKNAQDEPAHEISWKTP